MKLHLIALPFFSLALVLFAPQRAWGQEDAALERCFNAYEGTQVQLKDENYDEARELASSCSTGCPEEIATQCETWKREAERKSPTAILVARLENGKDAPGVSARVDGEEKPLQEELLLDPGVHSIVFSREDGWTYEMEVTIHRGEKGRTIRALVPREAPPSEPENVEVKPPPRNDHVPSAVASFSVGTVGFSVAGAFTVIALNRKADLEDCAPTCEDRLVRRAQDALTVADVSLVVGAVGAATGLAILLWGKPDDTQKEARLGVSASKTGAEIRLHGRFW